MMGFICSEKVNNVYSEYNGFGSPWPPGRYNTLTDFFFPRLHSLLLTTLNKGDEPTILVDMMLSQSEVAVKEETDSEILFYVMINESNMCH